MLVGLPNKLIPTFWPVFKDVLRASIPVTPDMRPDWLRDCLYQAMVGNVHFWLCYDPQDEKDEFYAAAVTKILYDDVTGQRSLLIYALQIYKKARREVRIEDMRTLGKVAKARGFTRLTAYCLRPIIANILRKAFPNMDEMIYCVVPIEDLETFDIKEGD